MNKTRKLDGNKNKDKTSAKAKKPQKRNKQITPKQARIMEKRSGSKGKRTKSNSQIYVGMDVQKKTIQMAVIDKNNKMLRNENILHIPATVKRFLESLPKNTKYVMESSSIWYNTFRIMRDDLGLDVTVFGLKAQTGFYDEQLWNKPGKGAQPAY